MFIVGIAGGSGSGKTTFSKKILQRVNDSRVGLIHLDSYYLPTPSPGLRVHGEPNFDHPHAFDWSLIRDHLEKARNGESIEVPTYDYSQNRRLAETETLSACQALLIEGIYTLWDPQIRSLFDLRVFLHVESDIRFIRRLHRDVRERSRTLDGIIRQYYDSVRPMYHEYLDPTRQFADFVVGEETDIAADVLAAKVRDVLR